MDRLRTTRLGTVRIRRNLGLSESTDAVEYCKKLISAPDATAVRRGKNIYVTSRNAVITINTSALSIIAAHKY